MRQLAVLGNPSLNFVLSPDNQPDFHMAVAKSPFVKNEGTPHNRLLKG
jgi:hypothetical protein